MGAIIAVFFYPAAADEPPKGRYVMSADSTAFATWTVFGESVGNP